MTVITRRLATALILSAIGFAAQAQTPPAATPPAAPATRIRGTILSPDGNILSVTTREGPVVKVTLNDPLTVMTVKKVNLADVTAGKYVGAAAEPGPDGELIAREVLVFPETGRGTGEGHFPWDLTGKSSMTNANVDAVVQGANGNLLTLTHKGGSVKIRVPAGVPVVTPAPAAREDLKPGQVVFFGATKAADGSLSAGRVFVAKDGVAPPM